MNPFFTIIIPTYNRAHTICTPIESILAQTFANWELIIVDDGSTDNTKEIIEGYQDVRIRYVRQENQERSAARNYGIRLAKGEWICFLDSDDEYLPEHLEVILDAIDQYPRFKAFRTGSKIIQGDSAIQTNLESNGEYDNFPFDAFHSFAIHSSLFDRLSFNNELYIGEDFHFLLRLGHLAEIEVIKKHTVIIHYNPENSGGIGHNYEHKLKNKIYGLEDMMIWNKKNIHRYLVRKRCLAEILLLNGHLKYKIAKIPLGILQNIQTCFRYPVEYMKLILRIIYVKFGEVSGFYRANGRF